MPTWTPPQPLAFVPDVTPQKELTAQQLRNISQAMQRLLAIANRDIRTVSLAVSTGDLMRGNDSTVVFTGSAASSAFTFLPALAMKTHWVTLVNLGTSPVALIPDPQLPDTIADASIPPGAEYTYQSDGVSAWYRVGSSQSNYSPSWTKYTVGYAALATAGLTNNIELFSLPAKGVLHAVVIKHSQSFTGGAIASYTVSVGIAGTLAKYATAFDVFQAVGNTVFQTTNVVGMENFGAATSIKIAATSTGANLNAATAGSCDIWILSSVLP